MNHRRRKIRHIGLNMVILFLLSCMISSELQGQGMFVEQGVSAFGVSGNALVNDDVTGFGLDIGYSAQGVVDIGLGVGKEFADESDLGTDLSATTLGPSLRLYPLKQSDEIPLSFSLGAAYAKNWFSSDSFDDFDLEVTGSTWVLGSSIFGAIHASPTFDMIPTMGVSYTSFDVKVKDTRGNSESADDEVTTFLFAVDFAFKLPAGEIFFAGPSISVNDDNTTFSINGLCCTKSLN